MKEMKLLLTISIYHNVGDSLSNQQAGDLSTLFDIGGIFGGIFAGLISDVTGMSAVTCAGSFILTIPMVHFSNKIWTTRANSK